MPSNTVALNDAQRRAIGIRLESMRRHLTALRAVGFESPTMTEIEELMREVASQTEAVAPEPPRNFVQGTLAQLWVLVMELRPRQMKRYGGVDEHAATYLEEGSQRLSELVNRLMNDYDRREGNAV